MQVTLTGTELARVVFNSLLWIPKDTKWSVCFVALTHFGVEIIAYDGVAVNLSKVTADVNLSAGDLFPSVVKVTREDLVKLEALARKELKNHVRLTCNPGETLYYSGENDDLVMDDIYEEGETEESQDDIALRLFSDLLEERREQPATHKFMIKTEYFRKFSQTKKTNPNICVDIWVEGDEPAFFQVGPESQTVIKPVDRQRNEEALGEGVLWT